MQEYDNYFRGERARFLEPKSRLLPGRDCMPGVPIRVNLFPLVKMPEGGGEEQRDMDLIKISCTARSQFGGNKFAVRRQALKNNPDP